MHTDSSSQLSDNEGGYPVGLPLCAEDCVAVRQLFCYNDWALIEDNKHRGIYFKSRGHFQLPNCETLPGFRGSTQSICSNARLTEMKVEEVTYDCVIGRGRFYQGTVNVTKYGLPCQYWDSQEPHSHYRPPDVFPEMKNAENYCRNAGGEEPSPWCYTLDPAVRWQRCDIPICGPPLGQESFLVLYTDTAATSSPSGDIKLSYHLRSNWQ
uniref:Kringle domain-containing protein n=1 Tax=Timema douglasi TaxID=61478 RepID=A0A7R8VJB2_TIMDO|nr:unnamed protein product [Timema douglasi]